MSESSLLNKQNTEKETYFLMEHEGADLISKFKLPVAASKLAKDETDAVLSANSIGYPVVLKGMFKDIVHKTEAGIVKLAIENDLQLKEAYTEIIENAKKYDPLAVMTGVLVQEMADKGIELIFGVKRDPIFGHQLIIGFGGTLVEIMKDFSVRMLPVNETEVEEMVKELKSYPILKGYRGQSGINLSEVKRICMGLNKLVQEKPEIAELDLNPVIFNEEKATICDVRILIDEQKVEQNQSRSLEAVEKMINPQSVAVIGASTNENKNGGRLFRYLVENKYPGKLYPINPGAKDIKGYKAYPNLIDVPGDVDLACIIVSSDRVSGVMRDCITKGVKAAIIYSSGFAEIGGEGEKLQEEVLALAKEGNIRVLGPNSIGIASPEKQIYTAFGAALESKVKVPGNIGFISQSGAMGSALLSKAWEQRVGFSRWISVANEADLSATDFIEVLAEDELTNVISVFMEGLKDAAAFERASKKALENEKPLLIYKTGRSDVGKRAVQSHTGTIAGDDTVYSAAFDKWGALQVNHLEDLIDVSVALDVQPLPNGNKIGVMTASGGACSVIADLCSEKDLDLPELTEASDKILELIPPFGSAQNPIDVTAEIIAQPEMFKEVLETLTQDPDIDGVIVMLTTNADPGASVIAKAILDVFKRNEKPIVVGRLGATAIAPQAMELYSNHHFPVYSTPEKVVNVMHYLVRYNKLFQKKQR
ncbi:acetate--CoA ligase family protein [Oceanobacillus jeddahense]|uniref:acetate--CoA ligase family protein n=1 Tax=Oceanobacillus jeddahense TaxID=1462527 RepID=UPI00059607DB|nr:acetate--CoA ligase family protein [Oceanobacillus jeddahense]